jgi:hypothetical protein
MNCGSCGNICAVSQTCCGGTCTGPVAALLSSNSNYFFDNACMNIVGLTVTLRFTQDVTSDSGFTVQLNADSPSGTDAWQQYGFSITGNSIQGFINNWRDLNTQIVCDTVGLASTPIGNGIPAGYSLVLQLLTDSAGNVTGATYQVFDNNGNSQANSTFLVQNAGCRCGGTCLGFMPGDLSPMTTFTFDIVGPGNGKGTTLTSGAGNITYSVSSGSLRPRSSVPACIETNLITAETSNAAYGVLNGCPSQSATQQFSFSPRTCTITNGPCTGAGGKAKCITVNGVTQCCHSNWLYGWWPWIKGCSDGQVEDQGCSGPCY